LDYAIDKKHEHEQQDLERFDALGIRLNGDAIERGAAGFAASQGSIFDEYEIPDIDEGLGSGPRDMEVDTGACEEVGVVPEGASLAAATNGPAESVFIAINGSGDALVCAFDSVPGEDDDEVSTDYKVAVQLRG
jgi:hypothetical protein